jgi:hypothetical protein
MVKRWWPIFFFVPLLFTSCGVDETADFDTLENRVREILDLPTFEHVYRDIIYLGEEKKFLNFIPTMEKRLLFAIDVHVQAGIDLSDGIKLAPGEKGEITVYLPPAKILLIDADESSITQYFATAWGGEIERLDYYDEIGAAKEEIRTDAIRRGILTKAGENGQKLLTNFLNLAGFPTVRFEPLKTGGSL